MDQSQRYLETLLKTPDIECRDGTFGYVAITRIFTMRMLYDEVREVEKVEVMTKVSMCL